jgi:hypothetical protein
LNIYEDGSDEEFLKLVKEFQNYIDIYNVWEDEHAAHTIYKNFGRCLAGAARDLWDQINIIDEDQDRNELTFDEHLKELISVILGEDALSNQKEYLKTTPKPEKFTVKQWINRIKNINSYLPLMQDNGHAFSEEELIAEVISKNIPSAWTKDFRLAKLHLKNTSRTLSAILPSLKNKSRFILKTLKSNNSGKISRIPAEFIMEDMNGMIVVKTLKIPRVMGKIIRQEMVTTRTKIMVALESKDAPKKVAVNLEHLHAATVVAVLETHLIVKVMNIIVSSKKAVEKRRKRRLRVLRS